MQVRELMTAPVITVQEETSLEDVARVLLEHDIGGVPVVNRERLLTGIVRESDFAEEEAFVPFSVLRLPRLFGHWLGRGASRRSTRGHGALAPATS